MNKVEYLENLRCLLEKHNIPKSTIDTYINGVETYFNISDETTVEYYIKANGDFSKIAETLCKDEGIEYTPIAENSDIGNNLDNDDEPEYPKENPKEENFDTPAEIPDSNQEPQNVKPSDATSSNKKFSPGFFVISLFSVPLTLILEFLVLLIGFVLFAVQIVLIPVLYVAMCAVILSGVLIGLVALVYGIVTMQSVFSIGLYELGIGISFLGFTMLFGILLYNVACALIPFLIKKTRQLIRFSFKCTGSVLHKIKKGVLGV